MKLIYAESLPLFCEIEASKVQIIVIEANFNWFNIGDVAY